MVWLAAFQVRCSMWRGLQFKPGAASSERQLINFRRVRGSVVACRDLGSTCT
jgi:hypothetical protein